MKGEYFFLIVLGIVILSCLLRCERNRLREGLNSGGLNTVNAVGWYNRQNHCWQDMYDGSVKCSTGGLLMS